MDTCTLENPIFDKLPGLSAQLGKKGLEFSLTHKKFQYSFDQELLRQFIVSAKYSKKN